MPNMMEDIKHIPPWLLVAGVGGIGALILLTRRHGGVGGVSTVPMASITATPVGALQASGLAGGPTADSLQSLSTLPQAAGPSTAAPARRAGYTLSDILHLEGQARNTDQSVALLQTAAQIDPQNQQLQNWSQQGIQEFNAPGHGYDPGGQLAWQNAGFGFLTQYTTQAAAGVGVAGTDPDLLKGSSTTLPGATAGGSGGGGADLGEVLPHGYHTAMTPDVLAGWSEWMGNRVPRAGLDDTQRYVARRTHGELSARHTATVDSAVSDLLGGF